MSRVAVFGAGGRMGATVCRAVTDDPDLILAGAVDPAIGGHPDVTGTVTVVAGCGDLDASAIDVAVDFSVADAARRNLRWCADNGIHAVVGTTGFDDADLDAFAEWFRTSNCLIAPNFAIGAVLMMRFAEMAAPFFPTAEVIEMHHDNKIDAPSGTAMRTLERMAAASESWGADPTEHEVVPGARGGSGPGGITVHSVRLRGLVAHQQVMLGTDGETLTLRHDSMDRSSFMGGVVHAVKVIDQHPGLTVGLDAYLGL